MSKELATRALFADALAGRIDRRTVLTRAAALGLSAPVAAALAQETTRAGPGRGRRQRSKSPSMTGCLDDHPGMTDFNNDFSATFPLVADIAPTANFSSDASSSEADEEDEHLGRLRRGHAVPGDDRARRGRTSSSRGIQYLPEGMLD